ncbi:MAG TPA: response regulator, partial [Candidatus Paceibacterota bacterium]|nr:response regulator [Candidatus Paceibacterota bacterium]
MSDSGVCVGTGRKQLNVLNVEDSEQDTRLLAREFRRGGLDARFTRVENAESLDAALKLKDWDLVICDYSLPNFSGMQALKTVRERDFDIPVIFVSGTMGEEVAVEAMRAGANDYLVKGNLQRLVPIIERELRDTVARAARKRAEAEKAILGRQLERINTMQQSLLKPAPLEAKLTDVTSGIVQVFNADFCRIWIIRAGDHCEECFHAQESVDGPHGCRNREKCLHLLASSGRYTHIGGKTLNRVPLGCYHIGRISSGEEHKSIIGDISKNPNCYDHEWAHKLGLVSFAGFQLRGSGGETIGVLAMFSARSISASEEAMLD